MRKLLILICPLFLLSVLSFGQKHIPVDELDKHLGETVTICDKIYSIELPDQVKNYSRIKVGKSTRKNSLFVQITPDMLRKLTDNGKKTIDNKMVCVTGKIILDNGLPQIVVSNSKSIHLTTNDDWVEIRPNEFLRFD